MTGSDRGIRNFIVSAHLAAVTRRAVQSRAEIRTAISELAGKVPDDLRAGPPFCHFLYITDVEGAYDVEIGFPVGQALAADQVICRTIPEMEVLSILHDGPADTLRERGRALNEYAAARAIISDEFRREVYPTWDRPGDEAVEIQFVRHRWEDLLARRVERTLGAAAAAELLAGRETVGVDTPAAERFRWVKEVVGRLEARAGDDGMHEILTGCAHIFPDRHIERMREAYREALDRTGDRIQAVDAVLAFRTANRPWGEPGERQGRAIVISKNPRDPEAHARATTAAEKRRAYCFCPIIRDCLEEGMPGSYCYCGAGWERRQWEGTIGEPVRARVLHSVLRGDDTCTFAIEIPD